MEVQSGTMGVVYNKEVQGEFWLLGLQEGERIGSR
jgi:hypothetical protein